MAKRGKVDNRGELIEFYIYSPIGTRSEEDTDIVDSKELIAQMESYRKNGYDQFRIYVNSVGGEVANGQALFSYLMRTGVSVEWVVDGIAASMAAVLLSNPKHKVCMNRYAKLMHHSVRGGCYGTAEEMRAYALMLDKFQQDIIAMLVNRMKKTSDEVRALFFSDGSEHWIGAQEALDLGLADVIIDGALDEPIPTELTSYEDVYNFCKINISNKHTKTMKDAKKFSVALNLAETDDEQVIFDAVQNVVREKQTIATDLAAAKAETDRLKKQLEDYEKGKVKSLIDSAIESKKISEDERATYTEFATNSYDAVEKLFSKMSGVKRVVDQLDDSASASRKDWDFDKYLKEGKAEELKVQNATLFKSLYKAKYGKEPKNI